VTRHLPNWNLCQHFFSITLKSFPDTSKSMKDAKYQFAAIGLMGILAMMIIPANFSTAEGENESHFWGAGTLVYLDAQGNEIFSQTVHNRIVDTGETYMLGQTFDEDGSHVDVTVDNNQIGAICIDSSITDDDLQVDTDFSGGNNLIADGSNLTCVVDTQVDIVATQGEATIGPLTFTEPINFDAGDLINGIGICVGNGGADYLDCATPATSLLFSQFDTTNVSPGAGESVQVTYTFDLTTTGS